MRAVKCTQAGRVEVVDVDPPAEDGVLVRVRSAGICGTDLSGVKKGPLQYILGHEIAGELEDGRPVAVEPIATCGTCDQCKSANYHRCRVGAAIGIGIGRNGGMAEMVRVPEKCIYPLPIGTRLQDASLIEPLAVALHGVRLADLRPGQRVAVIGAGSIGLSAVAVAVALGCEVGLAARHPHQFARGEKLGAVALNGSYDFVIECAGPEEALAQACKVARRGATVLLLSVYWDKIVLPGLLVMNKELRLVATYGYNRHAGGSDFESAAAMLARRPEIGDALITHRFSLEQAESAFETAANRKAGAIKVVMHPN